MWPQGAFGAVALDARFWWSAGLTEQQVVASVVQHLHAIEADTAFRVNRVTKRQ
jgi:hypothetical protein